MSNEQSVITVPVPEVEHILDHIRMQYPLVEGPYQNVPAHITIQYPWIEPHKLNNEVVDELEKIFSEINNFAYTLKIGWFGDEVLILIPQNPNIFIEMTERIISRWPEYPYYDGEYDEIEPHITLAYGDTDTLKEIYRDIQTIMPKEIKCRNVDLRVGEPGSMSIHKSFYLSVC